MLQKFLDLISYINSIFYGEYWYIAWGIIFLLLAFTVAVEVPKLVRSIKATKEMGKTNVYPYSGKQGSGKKFKYTGGDK